MTNDAQDWAEGLDEDVIGRHDDGTDEDYDGDAFGEGLADFPPDRPLGLDGDDDDDHGDDSRDRGDVGEEPGYAGRGRRRADGSVGELVDPAGPVDHEERLIADETDSEDPGPEASAMHIEPG